MTIMQKKKEMGADVGRCVGLEEVRIWSCSCPVVPIFLSRDGLLSEETGVGGKGWKFVWSSGTGEDNLARGMRVQ